MIYHDRIPSDMEKAAKKTQGRTFLAEDVDTSMLNTIPYQYPHRKITVRLFSEEFSCVCPFSGLPDYAKLTITYVPKRNLIELKSLKYYLYAYRNVKIYNEHVVNKVLEDLKKVLAPWQLTVTAQFTSRGGIANTVEASYSAKK